MTACLLDANVLIALLWPAHEAHSRARAWFDRRSSGGWATCPFTEAACVRVLSNPAFSADAYTPRGALDLLVANLKHPAHLFWGDDIAFPQAVEPFAARLEGHRQLTDAYLLGLALHRKGKLATMDRSIPALLAGKNLHRDLIEIV